MFDNLVESKATRAPRVGGSLASVAMHAALIALVVAVTANAGVAADEPAIDRLTYVPKLPPPPPPPPPVPRAPDDRVFAPVPKGSPALVVPIEVPDIIIPPDLTKAVTNPEDWKPMGVRGGHAYGDPAMRTPIANGDGVYTRETVDKFVVMAPGTVGPSYPEMLRAAGVDGTVLAQFIVDTLGRADLSTLVFVESAHPLFSDAVRRALPRVRFLPAESGGRRVRQLVKQPFRFGIEKK